MVIILMAVYNGEKYLAEQIDSILSQTYHDWKLVICDDCSSDDSMTVAEQYAIKYPNRISVHSNDTPTGSAKNNFMQMLHQCDAEYIMFSDQDDVWNNNKISVTLAAMQKCEALHPFDPILVHSDLIVADKDLNRISYSFMKYAGFNGKYSSLNRLLVQNNITGCTLMINRKLAELSHNTDCTRIIMHDWWLGLIAAAFGEICYLDCPTIKYRQHSNNQVGAKKANSIPQLLKSLKNKLKGNLLSTCTLQQAEYLMEKYKDSLPPDAYLTINQYIDLKKKNKFQRLRIIIKNKFLRQNPLQAFLQILFC